jgi:hypothetical protein
MDMGGKGNIKKKRFKNFTEMDFTKGKLKF